MSCERGSDPFETITRNRCSTWGMSSWSIRPTTTLQRRIRPRDTSTPVLDRVIGIRRALRRGEASRKGPPAANERLEALEARVAHLEGMIEGLQDAMHREITRMNSQIETLVKRTEPEEIARSLSQSARERGL
jgi:uncharacterized coiled-coil protein SlyX